MNTKLQKVVETIYQIEILFDSKDKDETNIRLHGTKLKKIRSTLFDEIFMDAPRCDNRFE